MRALSKKLLIIACSLLRLALTPLSPHPSIILQQRPQILQASPHCVPNSIISIPAILSCPSYRHRQLGDYFLDQHLLIAGCVMEVVMLVPHLSFQAEEFDSERLILFQLP